MTTVKMKASVAAPLPRFAGEDEGAAQIAASESPGTLAYVLATAFPSHRHK
jgi:hypothetical protein